MKKLSIIIPVYNNELNLRPLYEKLSKDVLKKDNFKYEIIFIDDGSEDNSFNESEFIKCSSILTICSLRVILFVPFGFNSGCLYSFGRN